MNQYTLGKIQIKLQDEPEYNADYYMITVDQLQQVPDPLNLLRSLQQQVEDPERIIIDESGAVPRVYSRQPDAILSLAMKLNQHLGTSVSEDECEALRERFIVMQKDGEAETWGSQLQ